MKLQEIRQKQAVTEGTKPYLVASNTLLKTIASTAPATAEALDALPGFRTSGLASNAGNNRCGHRRSAGTQVAGHRRVRALRVRRRSSRCQPAIGMLSGHVIAVSASSRYNEHQDRQRVLRTQWLDQWLGKI